MTIDGSGSRLATCVLAPNPSPMTLDGTNTWLIAAPGSSSVLVVDPGPEDEGHLRRVAGQAAAAGRRVAQILLTHGHSDHSAGARRLADLTGAPVRAADPEHRLGSEGLLDGDVVTAAGCELHVIGTPGHSADSLSFLLPADGALLTGDTVLGRGTTVIARGGSLADYLRTLDALKVLADTAALRVLLPGHGPVIGDPAGTLEYYIEHRGERLGQVRAALAAGDTTAAEIADRVYTDVEPALRRFAELSIQAQLDYLASLDLPASAGTAGQRGHDRLARRRAAASVPAGAVPSARSAGVRCRRMPAAGDQRARLRSRSASMISTDLAEICSQPRAAKSASALLTVSLDAPTSCASSSCVRS